MAVGAFEHDGEVVLDEARACGHGIFGEGTLGYVEGFARGEVVDSDGSGGEEGWVALGQVVASG